MQVCDACAIAPAACGDHDSGGVAQIMGDTKLSWQQKALALQEMLAMREEAWRVERDELHMQLAEKNKELEGSHARLAAQETEMEERLVAKDEEVCELMALKEEEAQE